MAFRDNTELRISATLPLNALKIVSAQKEIIVVAPVGPIRVSVILVPKVLQPLRVQGVLALASSAAAVTVVIVVAPLGVVVLILVHLLVPRRAVAGRVPLVLRPVGLGARAADKGRKV